MVSHAGYILAEFRFSGFNIMGNSVPC